jgi:hypothetical protein
MIRLVVIMYVPYPLSLRNVEDLLAERGIDIRALADHVASRLSDAELPNRLGDNRQLMLKGLVHRGEARA